MKSKQMLSHKQIQIYVVRSLYSKYPYLFCYFIFIYFTKKYKHISSVLYNASEKN